MKTRKIVLIIVLLIVFLFIAIWGIREYVLWNDGKLQKDNPMSKEEVLELLKKGEKYPNYYISFADSNNAKYDIYVKDNVLVEYYNNEFLLREDYNNNEYIMISKATDKEVRITVPGHTQRGGSPCAYDRVLATRLGAEAARAILEGDFGCMVGTKNQEIIRVPLSEVAGKLKYVDPKASIIDEAKTIGISFGDE